MNIGDDEGEAFTIGVALTDMLLDGPLIGEDSGTCFFGVFKSEAADTWYMGNQMMKDYYVTFDATAADERNEDYITFGIAKKLANHTLVYQTGTNENIFYDDDGEEIEEE